MKKASAKKTKAKKAAVPSSRKSAPKTKSSQKPAQKSGTKRAVVRSLKSKTLTPKIAPSGLPAAQKAELPAEVVQPVKSQVAKATAIKTQIPLTAKVPPAAIKAKPVGSVAPVRVDLPPEAGYSVVVDGHFKAHHAAEAGALADAKALKARFPFLRVEIFDAAKKTRSSVG